MELYFEINFSTCADLNPALNLLSTFMLSCRYECHRVVGFWSSPPVTWWKFSNHFCLDIWVCYTHTHKPCVLYIIWKSSAHAPTKRMNALSLTADNVEPWSKHTEMILSVSKGPLKLKIVSEISQTVGISTILRRTHTEHSKSCSILELG